MQNNFPIEFFPDNLQDIILETCGVFQFNNDFLCASVMTAASASIGNTHCINVKDGWIERNSIYLAIVAAPGINKSAPLSWALKPIEKREKEIYRQYKLLMKDFNADEKNADKMPPQPIKTIISDATPESVVQSLSKNERGIMIYNDELAGFLNTFQRYNKSNDEQFYLSVWSGKPVVVDRKTSSSIRIEEPVINIVGTIQPSIFEKSFNNKEDSGFFDRWLIVNPLNLKKKPWNDSFLPKNVTEEYQHIIDRLQDLQFTVNQWDEAESKVLQYSKEAWKLVKSWQSKNTSQINVTDMEHIRAIRAKMEIYIHRFCTIAHLIEYACGVTNYVENTISEETAAKAIVLSDYFIANAILARSTDQSISLPDDYKKLYDLLPGDEKPFTYAEVKVAAEFLDIPESSAKRWLKNQTGKLIIKIKHGAYAKK